MSIKFKINPAALATLIELVRNGVAEPKDEMSTQLCEALYTAGYLTRDAFAVTYAITKMEEESLDFATREMLRALFRQASEHDFTHADGEWCELGMSSTHAEFIESIKEKFKNSEGSAEHCGDATCQACNAIHGKPEESDTTSASISETIDIIALENVEKTLEIRRLYKQAHKTLEEAKQIIDGMTEDNCVCEGTLSFQSDWREIRLMQGILETNIDALKKFVNIQYEQRNATTAQNGQVWELVQD
jgi:hypothetical protein